jgi:hypothetical protein
MDIAAEFFGRPGLGQPCSVVWVGKKHLCHGAFLRGRFLGKAWPSKLQRPRKQHSGEPLQHKSD